MRAQWGWGGLSPTYCCASCLLCFTGIVILMLRIGFCARYFIQPWLQIITWGNKSLHLRSLTTVSCSSLLLPTKINIFVFKINQIWIFTGYKILMWSVIGCLVLLSLGYFMARKRVFNTIWLCTPGLINHLSFGWWRLLRLQQILSIMGITRMPYNHEWQNGHYNTHKNLFRA